MDAVKQSVAMTKKVVEGWVVLRWEDVGGGEAVLLQRFFKKGRGERRVKRQAIY
jgi:hypothetical protein